MDNQNEYQISLFDKALEFYREQNDINDFQNFYVDILQRECNEFNKQTINQQTIQQDSICYHSKNKSENQIQHNLFNGDSYYNIPQKAGMNSKTMNMKYYFAKRSVDYRRSSLFRFHDSSERFYMQGRGSDFSNLRSNSNQNSPQSNILNKTSMQRQVSPRISSREKSKEKFESPYDSIWIERTLSKSFNIKIKFDSDNKMIQQNIRPRCRAYKITHNSKTINNNHSKERNEKLDEISKSYEVYGQNQNYKQLPDQLLSTII